MTIDLFNLVVNNKTINIDSDIIIPNEYLENSGIRRLNNIHFKGNIKKLVDDTYSLEGVLSGTMILADDITLEDYEYNFTSEIEENIEETSINLQKTLDITDILWQNILIAHKALAPRKSISRWKMELSTMCISTAVAMATSKRLLFSLKG